MLVGARGQQLKKEFDACDVRVTGIRLAFFEPDPKPEREGGSLHRRLPQEVETMRRLSTFVPLSLVLFLASGGCQQQVEQVAAEAFDPQVEREEITALLKENVEAEKKGDIQGALKFYDQDVYTLGPQMKLMRGLTDMEGLYATIMASLVDMENEVTDIQFSDAGDMAFMIGSYHMVMKGDDGTHDEIGKMLAVLRKRASEWKIVAIAYNADPPE